MDTQTCYRRGMPRRKWTPPDPETAQCADAVVASYLRKLNSDSEYKQHLADAREMEIPISYIAERLSEASGKKVERKAVYRHLGQKMP